MACFCPKPPMNIVYIQQVEKASFPGSLTWLSLPEKRPVTPNMLYEALDANMSPTWLTEPLFLVQNQATFLAMSRCVSHAQP
jgi:hypothetical protein